jgi:phosphoribosyl 1,2-cyclic phosphate phosphodiesterase
MDLLFLGTGTSYGVPMMGCDCEVCRSSDPRNKRTRASVVFQYDGRNVLVDTATELRLQVIANGITHLDAVLFTHAHADHLHGLDDLRGFTSTRGPIDLYADARTAGIIRTSFAYILDGDNSYVDLPRVRLNEIDGPFELFGETIWPIELEHGTLPILGFRVHDVAYLTDCSGIPEASLRQLHRLKVLVIDAVRFQPHPTHFCLDEALEVIDILAPVRALITHISHHFDHQTVNAMLPANVELAYDGLKVTVP